MKDRMSQNPGRVLITPENGDAAFYATMTRADNPTQDGDPLCKETFLKDTTAALLGGDSSMLPDDAFVALKALSDIGASAAQIKAGTYAGTGSASFDLNLGGTPKFLVICPDKFYFPEHQTTAGRTLALYAGQSGQQLLRSNSRYVNPTYVEFTPLATGITVRGYGYNADNNLITDATMNTSGVTYYYFALL